MRKKTVALMLFLLPAAVLFSQKNTLYTDVSPSVLYLQHEIRLDSELCKNPDIVRKLEDIVEHDILDEYVPLLSGSGFFIDDEGTFLTNRHMVQIPVINSMRAALAESFTYEIGQRFSGKFRTDELNLLLDDIAEMVKKGAYRFSAAIGEDVFDELRIIRIADEDEPDIALVKLDAGRKFPVLKLAGIEATQELVGTNVFSFGYPLGSVLDSLFDDRVVTMNTGAVSAVRSAELDIQHSAAISPGNSGGPLTSELGAVFGMNTALLSEDDSNSLFYAISSSQLIGFLRDHGYNNLLKWNRRQSGRFSSSGEMKYNVLGEVETSSDLIVNAAKGTEIFIDGELRGEAPLYIQLDKPLNEIRIVGDGGEFSAALRVLSSISGTTSLSPVLQAPNYPVEFIGDDGIDVFVDGKSIGKTPVSFELPEDDYLFNFRKPGSYFEPLQYSVQSGEDNIIAVESRDAFKIEVHGIPAGGEAALLDFVAGRILSADEELVRIIFSSGEKRLTFSPEDEIYLPDGDWELSVEGVSEYTGMKIPVSVSGTGVEIDADAHRPYAVLTIRDLPEEGRVWIDHQEVEIQADGKISLPLGKRDVFIWKDGFQPMETDVTVRPGNKAFINWQKNPGHHIAASAYTTAGALTVGAGIVFMAIGGLYSDNDYAVEKSESYPDYLALKQFGRISFISGTIMTSGGLLFIPAISRWIAHVKNLDLLKQREGGLQ